jgi:DNA-binding CsgD family transcriptional regulator
METASGLLGRQAECAALDELLIGARAGHSQVLVLRGEAGIGKTALLDDLARRAGGCRVTRICGVESELELAFAGLHQLCAPMLSELDRLPAPQRDALNTLFGVTEGPAPDRFLVGLAVLGLVSHVAERQPLVCLIDDAQWLDRASVQTLEFVARRLVAESVVLVAALRTGSGEPGFTTLPELIVEGLTTRDAHELLGNALHGPFDAAVRARIVEESRGNPLALMEARHALTSAEFASGFGMPSTQPVAGRIEAGFRKRLDALPVDTRRLMLAAAVEPLGDASLLWRAAARLGVGVDAAYPAESEGLLDLGVRVRFRHPLVRSAVWRSASPQELREAHRALADATDPVLDGDRRAWHRAHAASGADEQVAAELERSAERARTRGGAMAAAAFLKRATELTPDAANRGRRALAAARSVIDAGAADSAAKLLAIAKECPLDDVQRARLERLRAESSFTLTRGDRSGPLLLLQAAQRLEGLDANLARETYLEALHAARVTGSADLDAIARAAGQAPPAAPERPCDLLLDGLAHWYSDSTATGAALLRRALGVFRAPDLSTEDGLRWLWLASMTAVEVWDDEALEVLTSRHLELARGTGSLGMLPLALNARLGAHILTGELTTALSLLAEMRSVLDATDSRLAPVTSVLLAAWRGDEHGDDPSATIAEDVATRGMAPNVLVWAGAVRAVGAGRYQDALPPIGPDGVPPTTTVLPVALVDVIEAASRLGRSAEASSALHRLTETTRASGTGWARGIEARCRALVSPDEEAEAHYLEAIHQLGGTRLRLECARAHLVYGEWLRRQGRRADARTQLRTAHENFTAAGARRFAERTRRELVATGESVRRAPNTTASPLTAQEAQIARLAAQNLTNPEIGAQLFLSPRTVEWHLRKVFSKLNISSRKELRTAVVGDHRGVGIPG